MAKKKKKKAKKKAKKKGGKKKAFGGYTICFAGKKDTVESVFGKAPIGPSIMTKKIWAYVKKKRITKI